MIAYAVIDLVLY